MTSATSVAAWLRRRLRATDELAPREANALHTPVAQMETERE